MGTPLPAEIWQAVVVTIPKPDKDASDRSNYRPISLLNTELKNFAKALATRILHLQTLIHPGQVGFVGGRQAFDGTHRVLHLLHKMETSWMPSLLLSLDAEKAFYRVHWGYLRATLSRFGFLGEILRAVMAIYSIPSARVYTNRMLSKPFNITNGIRQGCPLSLTIFALVMKLLPQLVRSTPEIRGVWLGEVEHKIRLFAVM